MYLFKTVPDLQAYLRPYREKRRVIGFVPTMGALHEGHLSLVEQSLERSQCTVCSIFVNPTQFNESSDLEQYPRHPERDLQLLYEAGCQAVFMPEVAEIYPDGTSAGSMEQLDFGGLDRVMEGAHRPGHFEGVAQVVKRLIDIVGPDLMFMGEKDYQQLLIVRRMVQQLELPVEVVGCAIVREADGLAMSSRNQRLNAAARAQAPAIYQALLQAAEAASEHSAADIRQMGTKALSDAGLEPEYFELADADTLQPVHALQEAEQVRAFAAAWAGGIRLIDNLPVKGGPA